MRSLLEKGLSSAAR